MTIRFSIVDEQPPSRLGKSRMHTQIPATWKDDVVTMRMLWEAGQDTLLETAFFEYFPGKKPPRWPDWLTKP